MASHRIGSDEVGEKGKATRRSRRVLLDSSFLIAVMERPTSWREDLLETLGSFEPTVIEPVYSELGRLAEKKRGKAARFASLARELVDSGSLKLEKVEGAREGRGRRRIVRRGAIGGSPGNSERVDEELVSRALEEKALVATIDKALIEQLSACHVGVVTLASGRVELRGHFDNT